VSTKAMMGAAVALAAILASPAFAGPADSTRNNSHNSPGAYARQTVPYARPERSEHPNWDVYDDRGHYVGTDPDPFIRDQLARDPCPGGAC
jgi:hypothetical protein